MLVLISPAKKLNTSSFNNIEDIDKLTKLITIPKFLAQSQELINILKNYTPMMLSKLMDISEDLANLNHQRFNMWEFDHSNVNTNKPALFMFNGDVYEGINPQSLDIKQIEKAQNHLKILSGLYGIINPLDNMQAYRLEMGTKLEFDIKQKPSLYKFWSDTQTDYIINEFSQNAYLQKLPKVIINLASDEYFKVINTKKLIQNDIKIIKINFEQNKNGIYKNISFLTKYARGLMVRFILQNDIKSITDLHKFNLDGYTYSESLSDSQNLYFRKS